MEQKLPYYMAYPMMLDFEEDRAERMDFEYLRSMYPEIPKTILPYVEEECDRMAYENSMIYDQYPDKLQLRLMCGRICADIKKHEKLSRNESMRELLNDMEQGGKWLRDLTEVMLYQELFRRRSGQRRSARRFY